MDKITNKLNYLLVFVSGSCLCLIMFFIALDIVSRFFSWSIVGASELAIFAMLITVFMGLSSCEEDKDHVSIELLTMRVSPRNKKILSIIGYTLTLCLLAVLIYGSYRFAMHAFLTNKAIVGPKPYKLYPVSFAALIGLIAYFLQILVNLKKEIFLFGNNKDNSL